MKPTYFPLYFLTVWRRSMPETLWWKQRKRVYFCICASTNLLQTEHNISRICCTKVHEIFARCRGSIGGLGVVSCFAIFPIVVKMLAQTIGLNSENANLSPSRAATLVAMAASLETELHRIFSQPALRSFNPLSNERDDV